MKREGPGRDSYYADLSWVSEGHNIVDSERQHSREIGWVEGRLDDPCIDGQDGEDDTTQEDQGKLVDVLDTHKDHSGHAGKHTGAIYPHIVQHGCCLPTGIFCLEDGHGWKEISLQERSKASQTDDPGKAS